MSKFLAEALEYCVRGWSIIPIRHRPGRGKESAVRWKRWQDERADEAQIRKWFTLPQLDGLAVMLGSVSGGLVCRDFDTQASYDRWAAAHPELAGRLPTVTTSRGRHVYFRSEWTGYIDMDDGELRGNSGHYCLLPPSIHPSGHRYEWIIPLPSNGDIPIIDPIAAGLAESDVKCPSGQKRQTRQKETEETEDVLGEREGGESDGKSLKERLAKALRASLPTNLGQRDKRLFAYARHVRGILGDKPSGDDLCRAFDLWWAQAKDVVGTKDRELSLTVFLNGYLHVKWPANTALLENAMLKAKTAGVPACAERFENPKIRLLVALCRELQSASPPGEPFFLSCRSAAEQLGENSHTKVSLWLGSLVALGILRIAVPHTRTRAIRYFYVGGE